MSTIADNASEPLQDRLQDNAATRRNSPAATSTERIIRAIFSPLKDYYPFLFL
jgi:hypothetical protein